MQSLSRFFLSRPSKSSLQSSCEPLFDVINTARSHSLDSGYVINESDHVKEELSDFEFLNLVGAGTFGRVYRVKSKVTAKEYAIKVLKKSIIVRLKQIEHVKNETQILKSLVHPFLIRLYRTYMDDNNIYLLMELSKGGEFFALLRAAGRLSKESTQFYAAEMVLVLEYLHSFNIAYRDLKPENVLLSPDGHIKICDFGFSKIVIDRTWTLCGTPEYLSPEVIMGTGHDKSVDWWALGVLIYEMYAGYPPFFGEHPFEIYEKICDGRYQFPHHFDDKIKDLITKLLQPSRARRLGNLVGRAKDVKDHEFFCGVDWEALNSRSIKPPHVTKNYPKPEAIWEDEPEEEEQDDSFDPSIFQDFVIS